MNGWKYVDYFPRKNGNIDSSEMRKLIKKSHVGRYFNLAVKSYKLKKGNYETEIKIVGFLDFLKTIDKLYYES